VSGCTDKRFEEMLYAWELGLLDEPDERELEIHLLECESCFEKVQRMSQATELLRHSERVRSEMLKDNANQETVTIEDVGSSRRFWPRFLTITLAAAAVFVFLLLQPWDIQISPTNEAIAVENRLAIMYFRNLVDPADTARLGEIATNLLITDLSESQFVDVVSSQRLYDATLLKGLGDPRSIEPGSAPEIARETRARWMLLGDILQIEPRLELTIQLLDIPTGDILASKRITGDDGEDIFSLVDRLSVEVKSDLALPMAAFDEPDRQVADVTTHSAEAYRWYLEGLENLNKVYRAEAIVAFEKALEYDSTMAMAHYHLAMLKDRDHLEKAVKYASGTSQRERSYILVLQASAQRDYEGAIAELHRLLEKYPEEKQALYRLGRYHIALGQRHEAIGYLEEAVRIDPLYKVAYNQLAYTYLNTGDYEKSLVAINKYIEIAPDEANPYDSRGDICAAAGRLNDAIASYQKAIEIKPDFPHSLMQLGYLYLFDQEYDRADSCLRAYTETVETPYLRSAGRLYQAYVPVHQGKYNEALRLLDKYLAEDSLETQPEHTYDHQAQKRFLKALIYADKGDWENALLEVERTMALYRITRPDDRWAYQYMYAEFLANAGYLDRAKAAADELKTYLESLGHTDIPDFWYADGCIKMARGDYNGAETSFGKAAETNSRLYLRLKLAKAYLFSDYDHLGKAVDLYEKIISTYNSDRAFQDIGVTQAHYYLGLAYEESRWYDKAAEQYRILIDKMKDADPIETSTMSYVDDARVRLTRLKALP